LSTLNFDSKATAVPDLNIQTENSELAKSTSIATTSPSFLTLTSFLLLDGIIPNVIVHQVVERITMASIVSGPPLCSLHLDGYLVRSWDICFTSRRKGGMVNEFRPTIGRAFRKIPIGSMCILMKIITTSSVVDNSFPDPGGASAVVDRLETRSHSADDPSAVITLTYECHHWTRSPLVQKFFESFELFEDSI
jgi:hypothetical protein